MLPVSDIVRVSVSLNPLAASVRSFGTLMIAGDSDVINPFERFRTYTTIEEVAADFGVDAPEYKAAVLYFGQNPSPGILMVGRWVQAETSAENLGGLLSASEQSMSNWTSISAGAFDIDVDGVTLNLTGLDFSGETNLNGVASVITAAFSGAATCVWTGSYFEIISATTGRGTKASGTITLNTNPSPGVRASGTVTLTGNPDPGDTVTINSTSVEFVASSPTGNEVVIGMTPSDTSDNLQEFLEASADTGLAACIYHTSSLVTTVTARVYGTAGNVFSLAKSGTNISVSGAGTLTGGVAADTLTVNSVALTFVASGPSGNQILVAPTAAQTSANIQAFLAASANSNLILADYSTESTVTTVEYKTVGEAGNAYTLAESSSHISVSGANLTGGTEGSTVGYATTGIAAQLKLTSGTNQAVIDGYDAETPAECAAILAEGSSAWYGLMFQASVQPTDDESIDVSDFIEALDLTRIYGVTISDTNVLSALVTTDLASRMRDGSYLQSFCQYSQNLYAVASLFGRAFTVDFTAQNTTLTLMFKQEPGVTGEDLTSNQASILQDKRCNVYVDYQNDTVIIQTGIMSGDAYIDEIHGTDWLQNAIQTACYNVLYLSTTKIPQTDAGVNQLTNAIAGVCGQAVNNGLVAAGTWNGPSFGQLVNGDFLKTGFYIYAQPVALQSQSDRDLRKSPPIQVAIKLAGAIQSVDILVDVNR